MHAARFMRRLAKDHGRVVAAATAATAALAASAGTATDGVARSEGRLATTAAPFHWAQPWHATASSSSSPLPALARAEELRARYACQSDRVLGRGGFGLVLEARCRRSDRRVALKRVAKRATSRAKFLQEVAILRALGGRHHVLSLCEAFETPDAFVLVTELVEGRELFEQLVEHGALDERRAQQLARQLARALAHVHAQGVVHGDLKPENVLVTDDETKLIDFGQAFREREASERARCVGSGVATTAYAAPEVLAATHATEEKDAASELPLVDRAIDLWGLGVVLYTALCGFHPFDPENDASDAELVARIRRGAFETDAPEWEALPAPARELVTRLLQVDAAQRPSAAEVLQCAWLRQPQ